MQVPEQAAITIVTATPSLIERCATSRGDAGCSADGWLDAVLAATSAQCYAKFAQHAVRGCVRASGFCSQLVDALAFFVSGFEAFTKSLAFLTRDTSPFLRWKCCDSTHRIFHFCTGCLTALNWVYRAARPGMTRPPGRALGQQDMSGSWIGRPLCPTGLAGRPIATSH